MDVSIQGGGQLITTLPKFFELPLEERREIIFNIPEVLPRETTKYSRIIIHKSLKCRRKRMRKTFAFE